MASSWGYGSEAEMLLEIEGAVGKAVAKVLRAVELGGGDIDDIKQEATLACLEAIDSKPCPRERQAYLCAVARNTAIRWVQEYKPTIFEAIEDRCAGSYRPDMERDLDWKRFKRAVIAWGKKKAVA